jgi:hypothetical protein
MFKTPVLLIVFNRPDTTKLVLDVLQIIKPQNLFIACDGPRQNNLNDAEFVNEVRILCNNIDWDCNINRLYQDINQGCSKGPRIALNWFFSNVEAGIILEDDCLPSIDFFYYCETLLEYYKNDDTILNICGSNMGYSKDDASGYFYSRFMNMSGWATWRRSERAIDYELESWKKVRYPLLGTYKMLRQGIFDFDINWYKYWKDKFDRTVYSTSISWWDWQWIYYQLNTKKYSVIPNKNLVTNIGFNDKATHTKDPNNPLANVKIEKLIFPLKHPTTKKPNYDYEEFAVKWVWCYHKRLPFLFYLKQFVSRFIKK